MTPYLALYVMLISTMLFTWKKENNAVYSFSCLIIILFIGLRDPTVGADTIGYLRYLNNPGGGYGDEIIERKPEVGYQIFNSICNFLSINDALFLVIVSIFSMSGALYFIHKKSSFRSFSLLMFFFIPDLYRQPLFLLRQAIAMSIFLFAIDLFESKANARKFAAFLLFALAISFHTTAIFPVALFLITSKLHFHNSKYVLATLIGSMILGSFQVLDMRSIFRLASSLPILGLSRIAGYGDFLADEWAMSQKDILFQTVPITTLTIIAIRSLSSELSHLKRMLIVSCIFYNISAMYPLSGRINAYAFPLLITFLPSGIKRNTLIGNTIYLMIILFYLRSNIAAFNIDIQGSGQAKVAPYSINAKIFE